MAHFDNDNLLQTDISPKKHKTFIFPNMYRAIHRYPKEYSILMDGGKEQLKVVVFRTHIASRNNSVSTSADHGCCHLRAPPVVLTAGGVVHNGQQSLLQDVSDGTSGCAHDRHMFTSAKGFWKTTILP